LPVLLLFPCVGLNAACHQLAVELSATFFFSGSLFKTSPACAVAFAFEVPRLSLLLPPPPLHDLSRPSFILLPSTLWSGSFFPAHSRFRRSLVLSVRPIGDPFKLLFWNFSPSKCRFFSTTFLLLHFFLRFPPVFWLSVIFYTEGFPLYYFVDPFPVSLFFTPLIFSCLSHDRSAKIPQPRRSLELFH